MRWVTACYFVTTTDFPLRISSLVLLGRFNPA